MSDDPSHSSSQRAKHLRGVVARIADSLNNDVPPLVVNTTNQVLKEMKSVKDDFYSRVSQELADTAPQHIEEFLWNYMPNHAITLQSPARIPILKLQEQLYTAMKDSP
ncbi:hypothetical protein Tco_0597082 [Tanacetum coccineum]